MTDLFQRKLENFMDDFYAKVRDDLAAGFSPDYADYRYRTGHLRAIEEIGHEIKRIRQDINTPIQEPTDEPKPEEYIA